MALTRRNIQLWTEFHRPLLHFVAKRVRNQVDVDDIVQTVFMKIHLHVNDIQDGQKIKQWIYRITRNCIVDYYRKEKSTQPLPDHLLVMDEYEDEDALQELAACIRPMIQQLPAKYREALELTELNGMSQKQLSEHLHLSFSGTKSRVQRGREKLKDLFLACCRIEADRYGNIIDVQAIRNSKCEAGPCGCQ
nr:RNA polymerase sigma factor SigZ [Paenibacillus cymbidii]